MPFEDRVVNELLHFRESMLEFVGHDQSRKASADGNDAESAWCECILIVQGNRVLAGRDSDVAIGLDTVDAVVYTIR